jgi:hypothetical protein
MFKLFRASKLCLKIQSTLLFTMGNEPEVLGTRHTLLIALEPPTRTPERRPAACSTAQLKTVGRVSATTLQCT